MKIEKNRLVCTHDRCLTLPIMVDCKQFLFSPSSSGGKLEKARAKDFSLDEQKDRGIVCSIYLLSFISKCQSLRKTEKTISCQLQFFLPPEKPTLLNSNSKWKQWKKSLSVGRATANSYLFYIFILCSEMICFLFNGERQ